MIPFYQVDAFTGKLFGGNPAGVCPLVEWIEDDLMQKIAEENNLSETAFFVDRGEWFEITWFTPAAEVDLCGHATLASAHVIFNHLNYPYDVIMFDTKHHGPLYARRNHDLISLDFPAGKPEKVPVPDQLILALGCIPAELYATRDYLAVFDTQEEILAIKPNFGLFNKLDKLGVCVTAPGREADFVSRFFAPSVGINEDPVTGSAHTTLIPFWADRLQKTILHALQLSRRGGELFCELNEDRVLISGRSVTFLEGEIHI
ncbi:MAG: PhzF family phenazine biosynthesis protein [Bacteroidales bacterium]|nr:PhzF family phenazine biosynthesis protein [Bacteroidales bacterium]